LRYLLILRRRACENFFRPRAKSTFPRDRQHSVLSRHLGEGKGNFQFPCPLGEKNFSHNSAYAPLRRKTKRTQAKIRQNKVNDKDKILLFVIVVSSPD
jgi:hypothetical protein